MIKQNENSLNGCRGSLKFLSRLAENGFVSNFIRVCIIYTLIGMKGTRFPRHFSLPGLPWTRFSLKSRTPVPINFV